jgi:hypothetical protein
VRAINLTSHTAETTRGILDRRPSSGQGVAASIWTGLRLVVPRRPEVSNGPFTRREASQSERTRARRVHFKCSTAITTMQVARRRSAGTSYSPKVRISMPSTVRRRDRRHRLPSFAAIAGVAGVLAAGLICDDLQAHLALARVGERPPSSTPTSLPVRTKRRTSSSGSAVFCSASTAAIAEPTSALFLPDKPGHASQVAHGHRNRASRREPGWPRGMQNRGDAWACSAAGSDRATHLLPAEGPRRRTARNPPEVVIGVEGMRPHRVLSQHEGRCPALAGLGFAAGGSASDELGAPST